jgi:hypothetical protein
MTTNLKEILIEWQSNLKFREAFKKNPIAALRQAGFEVNDEDLAKIKSQIKKSEELDKRINK